MQLLVLPNLILMNTETKFHIFYTSLYTAHSEKKKKKENQNVTVVSYGFVFFFLFEFEFDVRRGDCW